MANFIEAFTKVNDDFQAVNISGDLEAYSRLANTLERFEASLREYIQFKGQSDLEKIIRKLKGNTALTSNDLEQIRPWIVGDADHYISLENNFRDWLTELKRIIGEINHFLVAEPDVAVAFKLRGLLRDGIRLLWNVSYFLQEKERVDNFNRTTEIVDPEERQLLIKILEQKLKSPNF